MSAIFIVFVGIFLFIAAYFTYGRYVSKRLGINPDRKTPAHRFRDGVDYVPAKAPILLGHHFASIAGAGPILGPIIASQFGWGPVLLWIVLGGIFLGGVHDMGSLAASLRHEGKSIGQIIENYMGRKGKILFLIFAFLTLVLVIAAFTKIVSTTFTRLPAVATASTLFILLAIIFGFFIYRKSVPLVPATVAGVALLFVCISLGSRYPMVLYRNFQQPATTAAVQKLTESGDLGSTHNYLTVHAQLMDRGLDGYAADVKNAAARAETLWTLLLLIYVSIAAVTPVWILLQPRDYLNSFLLYFLLLGGIAGVFFARPAMVMSGMTAFKTNLGYLFPVLFVYVACGAISGFHSMVASGTTSKQVNKESDAKLIGYGGMLIESVLAILALIAAATMLEGKYNTLYESRDFIGIFSEGVGWFMSKIPLIGIKKSAAVTFSGLAVSAFALTTLDTTARLARFIFQEFFTPSGKAPRARVVTNRFFGTGMTILVSALFLFSGSSAAIWPVFGSANQLLAALALLAITVWLTHEKKPRLFAMVPMFFMYSVTLTALVTLIIKNYNAQNYPLTAAGAFLLVVALLLAVRAIGPLFGPRTEFTGTTTE